MYCLQGLDHVMEPSKSTRLETPFYQSPLLWIIERLHAASRFIRGYKVTTLGEFTVSIVILQWDRSSFAEATQVADSEKIVLSSKRCSCGERLVRAHAKAKVMAAARGERQPDGDDEPDGGGVGGGNGDGDGDETLTTCWLKLATMRRQRCYAMIRF